MSAGLARRLGRPLAERERTRLFAATAVALALAAFALTFLAPPHSERPSGGRPRISATTAVPPTATPEPPAVVMRTGRLFLADYLSYMSGRARGRTFRAASASLRNRLSSHPPRVSPAMRRRRAHVVNLTGHRLASRSRWVLTATIADGGVRYPVELVVATRPRSTVVIALGEV
jgi:hypothetical protein